jgi:hypothetical protein
LGLRMSDLGIDEVRVLGLGLRVMGLNSTVDVDVPPEHCLDHGAALDVPSGPARTPRTIPPWLRVYDWGLRV